MPVLLNRQRAHERDSRHEAECHGLEFEQVLRQCQLAVTDKFAGTAVPNVQGMVEDGQPSQSR